MAQGFTNKNKTALPSGSGDMVLASTQTVSGLKTFLAGMFGLRNVANSFTAFFTNTITANRTYTLKDADGTIAFTSDITGTNSGTNTGDNATNTQYSGLAASKEDVVNKTIDFDAPSNTLYPTSLAVSTLVATKQATLVSGTNIKSVNGVTILGSGDLFIQDVPLNIFTLAGNSSIATETVRIVYFKYNISTFQLTINGTGKLLILQ